MESIEQRDFPGVFLNIPSRNEWLADGMTVGQLRALLRDFMPSTKVVFRDGEDRECHISAVSRTTDTVELS